MRVVAVAAAVALTSAMVTEAAGDRASGSGAASAAGTCPSHAHVIASSQVTVAYRQGDTVFACYRPTGRRYRIGVHGPATGDCSENVSVVRVAGRYAAWALENFCFAESHFYVERADVARGHSLRAEPTGTAVCPPATPQCGDVGIGPAVRIVLDWHASVAWIAGNDSATEVWRFDGRGRRPLAAGADIDRKFLGLRHHRVEWRQAGKLHRASLRP